MARSKKKTKSKKPAGASHSSNLIKSPGPPAPPTAHAPAKTSASSTRQAAPSITPKYSPFSITPYFTLGRQPIYVVRPDSIWNALERFHSCTTKATNDSQVTLPINTDILLHRLSPLSPTSSDLGLWVARILEVKASDPTHVYLRVFYYFRPDQLPKDVRRKYDEHHRSSGERAGEAEGTGDERNSRLIASNEMEIVHADCIKEIVDVVHLKGDAEEEGQLREGQWWWKLKYDVMHSSLSSANHNEQTD